MGKTQDEEYFQSWSKTYRWNFFENLSKSTFWTKVKKINNFVVIISQFWTVWKSDSTVLEHQRETGKLTISERPMEEALWIGDSYAISKWQRFLHFELVTQKTTLSTTQNLHYQLHLKVETGKLTISECPLEEAMRIGHWVTIQQFHSGKNFCTMNWWFQVNENTAESPMVSRFPIYHRDRVGPLKEASQQQQQRPQQGKPGKRRPYRFPD